MENFGKPITKDRLPENVRTLEQIEESNHELIQRAKHELEILKPTLRDLIERVRVENPDIIIFLDKGARIFATPIRRYLQELDQPIPKMKFYNDDELKHLYVEGRPINNLIESDFRELRDKKVFFIDETFSTGRGAVPLRRAMDMLHLNAIYFALSRDPQPKPNVKEGVDLFSPERFYKLRLYDHIAELNILENDPRFRIYDNRISTLFTKQASKLYIIDNGLKTTGRYELIPNIEEQAYDYTPKAGEIPHTRAFTTVPENMSWMEYDQKVRELNMTTVNTLKDEIYKTLGGSKK